MPHEAEPSLQQAISEKNSLAVEVLIAGTSLALVASGRTPDRQRGR
jgi:hypothetical protein